MNGGNGKLLRVDLSKKNIDTEVVDEGLVRKYFGGSGLAGYLFTKEFDIQVDPLSPENPLFIVTGLLTGTPVLTACKTSVCSRSPLTGIWGEATVGGFWGAELKHSGYDGVIFIGRSDRPVYLWVCGETVELKNASEIWGNNTFESDRLMRAETDAKAKVMCIGQAGERKAKLASIMVEGTAARAAGRTGLGAVMGSKQLKGIVVRRTKGFKLELADRSELMQSLQEISPSVVEYRKASKLFGTNGAIGGSSDMGDLPVKNWQIGDWSEKVNKISGQRAVEKYLAKHYACHACSIRCGKELKWDEGLYSGIVNKGPEYETVAGFGSNLLIDDLKAVVTANAICNDYGVDTIGASAVIAAITEACDRKLITADDLDGIAPRWGDAEAMLELLTKLVSGDGIGKKLENGTQELAHWFGDEINDYILAAKGLDFALHDPRAFMSLGLSYATSNRGACHLEGMVHSIEWGTPLKDYGYEGVDRFSFDGKGKMTAISQNYMACMNALGLCKFIFLGRVGPSIANKWTRLVMGWDMSLEEFMQVGERLYNLKRLFNVKLGVTRKSDNLPKRIFTLALKDGGTKGHLPDIDRLLPDYYDARGWDEHGIPKSETIDALGLNHIKSFLDK